jgi:UDP-N-acetylmuramate dehydrogenase
MKLFRNYPLRTLNTFGLEVDAKYLVKVASVDDLFDVNLFRNREGLPLLVMGGGSNILFTSGFKGLVALVETRGWKVTEEDERSITIIVNAGVVWDEFVAYCAGNNFWGLENLSYIPGRTGASPIQNIGAYGVEMKDCFTGLEAFDLEKGDIATFTGPECRFGYRDSFFKNEGRGRYVITTVSFRLQKDREPSLGYGDVKEELKMMDVTTVDAMAVRVAIGNIRRSRLPEPSQLGNAGSFFKNPVVPAEQYLELLRAYPDMPGFIQGDSHKLSAGWLIERCGWKGKRMGNAGVYEKQALILVNHGKATGREVLALASAIQEDVQKTFGVRLEREVVVV